MANLSIERIYRALPDKPMRDEAELDEVLRHILKIPEWDNAKLGGYKAAVKHWQLVVRGPDGLIRKSSELPKPKSENDRIAEIAAEQRRQRELLAPDANYANPQRVQTEQFIQQVVGERFAALEEQMADLQQ